MNLQTVFCLSCLEFSKENDVNWLFVIKKKLYKSQIQINK